MVGVGPTLRPFNFEITAAQFDGSAPVRMVGQNGRYKGCACAAAARPCFSRATLPYTHLKMMSRAHLYEFGVYAPRQEGMMLKLAAEFSKIEIAEFEHRIVLDEHDAVRITHRNCGNRLASAGDLEPIINDAAVGLRGNLSTVEDRLAHIDRSCDYIPSLQL